MKTLEYISSQAAAHGLNFQLGLWMHGYEWANSPHANYTIAGLNPENHAAYCRDALGALLRACPAISGVTFRIHGESGVTARLEPATIDGLARGLEVPVSVVRAAAAESTGMHYYDEPADEPRAAPGDQERELLIASIDELTPEDRRHVAALVESLRNRSAPPADR